MIKKKLPTHGRGKTGAAVLVEKYSEEFGMAYAAFVRELESGVQNESTAPSRIVTRAGEVSGGNIPVDDRFMAEMLGIHLRRMAAAKKISMKEIARKLRVHPSNITRIFQRPEKSSLETLMKIARTMNVPIADFFDGRAAVEDEDILPARRP